MAEWVETVIRSVDFPPLGHKGQAGYLFLYARGVPQSSLNPLGAEKVLGSALFRRQYLRFVTVSDLMGSGVGAEVG